MNPQTNPVASTDSADALLYAAQSRLRHLKKWWPRLWGWHNWLTGVAVILSGVVPFGLGILLFTPPENTRTLNIILIVITAAGFVAQVWNVTQRNRDRAQHLRAVAAELEMALVSFQSGLSSREEFAKALQGIYAREAQEPAV